MSEKKRMPELTPEEAKENERAVIAHTIAFPIWLTMMMLLGDPCGWRYAAQTIVGFLALLVLRPWRWYPRLKLKNVPVSIGVGVLIFFVWVGFETPWMKARAPAVAEWYDKLFVDFSHPLKLRETTELPDGSRVPYEDVVEEGELAGLHVYDPRVTGWPMFWLHMFGTSVVIAVIEEFFFRGFLYRWMLGTPFYKIDPGRLHWPVLLMVSVFFGLEHFEWLAGILCGLAFGLLYIKTKDVWAAIIAHGTTNFLLGLYAVQFGAYQFW